MRWCLYSMRWRLYSMRRHLYSMRWCWYSIANEQSMRWCLYSMRRCLYSMILPPEPSSIEMRVQPGFCSFWSKRERERGDTRGFVVNGIHVFRLGGHSCEGKKGGHCSTIEYESTPLPPPPPPSHGESLSTCNSTVPDCTATRKGVSNERVSFLLKVELNIFRQ